MRLQLTRPLVFFDLETTGVNVATDRIVEISLVKQFPNGNTESKTWRVNPGMHIPKEASDVHHIMDEDVADMPPFKELAPEVLAFIDNCDLAGYNSNHFDVPMLQEELLRADFDVDLKKDHHFVDAFVIFQKHTPRNLTAAYKHYCGKDLVGAHGANADTEATREVLLAQLDKHSDVPVTVEALEEYTTMQKTADLAGRIGYDALGREVFAFGKHKGHSLAEVFAKEPSYYTWIQEGDFPLYTKRLCKQIMEQVRTDAKLRRLQEKYQRKQQQHKTDAPQWDAKPGELQF